MLTSYTTGPQPEILSLLSFKCVFAGGHNPPLQIASLAVRQPKIFDGPALKDCICQADGKIVREVLDRLAPLLGPPVTVFGHFDSTTG